MRLTALLLLAAAASPLAAPIVARAAEVQIAVENPVVELTITETVMSEPDTAIVGAGVTVRAPSASAALRQNAAQMTKVIDKLKALGIRREDIQTSNFNLNAQYQYRNDGQQPTFLGYDASNSVNVTLRDMTKIGETLDALVGAGANNVYGPNFSLSKDEPARVAGRKSAFERAGAQAREYAAMAGYSGVRLLEVSETYNAYSPPPMPMAITVTARRESTPIEPGQVGTAVTLTAKYEMTR
ncbi:hypothetical protein B2G71_20720 [Novosphingobium sp. PC22D]|uniref:SIMPL domain-containing protein n=1 Tax=Novosphingobium sp. PC22D TaxID=1962403 RepID=UPI000BF149E4|nr:SIMPL domain-containing protein [Novosphingobium sp. PC22D]PEQ10775.1 hypothetical protein B2G71_20720 [Novosphingobium sp. PC22D]